MTEWDEVVNSPNPPTIPAPWESLTKALPYRGWRHGKWAQTPNRPGGDSSFPAPLRGSFVSSPA